MSAQIAADLRAAAEVLERDGWTQKLYHDEFGCHCAEGAIALSVGQHVHVPDGADADWWANHPDAELLSCADWSWFAVPGTPAWDRRWEAEAALARHLGIPRDGVANWNDQPGRTKAEVVAALRAAADAAEATS